MRKIAANIIYPVSSEAIKNGYLVLDNDGTILDVVNTNGNIKEIAGLEYYSGVLIPGFVNAHCHLELSHLKGKIESGLGLEHFISQVPKLRKQADDVVQSNVEKQLKYMWSRGVNGFGDIMNANLTIPSKKNTRIHSYSFVELFNLGNKAESEIWQDGLQLLHDLEFAGLKASISPHSKYAVSDSLLAQIIDQKDKKIATVHFLEHPEERNYSETQILEFLDSLIVFEKVLLVHNLYLDKELLDKIKTHPCYEKIWWVLCPNSNLFIENKLPDIDLIFNNNQKVCLGTDSLASNNQLSILEEMKTIAEKISTVPFNALLKWSTQNGAEALSMENQLGSFEKGKKPGVLLLSNFNFEANQISTKTEVTRLV